MTEVLYEKRLLRVEEYEEMGRTGILGPEERVELIHGEIVRMSPQNPLHSDCIERLTHLFVERLKCKPRVRVQLPVTLDDWNAPEPDLANVRPQSYAERHPGPKDIFLVVEVAVTTLAYDRQVKLPLYAGAGVPEVWIVNFDDRVVEVYRDPANGGYSVMQVNGTGAEVGIAMLPEMGPFKVEEILG